MYGGDRGSRAGCRRKSVMFLFFLILLVFMSRFGITNVCDNGNAMSRVIFKTIMVPLHRGMFLVVDLFQIFL